jgi:hypothetical protein
MQWDKQSVLLSCDRLELQWSAPETARREPGFCPFRSVDLVGYLATIRRAAEEPHASCDDVVAHIGDGDFDAVYGLARVLASQLPAGSSETRVAEQTVELGQACVVAGDLVVDGDLENGGILVVLGDLRVGGLFWDRDVGCQLVVTGSAEIARANVYGGARIRGDLKVTQALWGIDHSDGIFVGGDLRACLVMLDDKSIRAAAAAVEVLIAEESLIETPGGSCSVGACPHGRDDLERLFVPELIFAEGEEGDEYDCPINVDALLERLASSRPVWR